MNFTKKTVALMTAAIIGLGVITAPLVADGSRNCGGKDGAGFAMMGGHHMGKNADRMIGKMARKLDMTEEQRDRAFTTADEYRPKFREIKFAIKDNMKSLHGIDSDAADFKEKSASLADKQGDLVAEIIKLKTAMHADIEGILTDEQKAKFEKFKQRREHHRDGHDENEVES